ncbi:unnamed protein product, partial [Rotaria socialis]
MEKLIEQAPESDPGELIRH